MFYATTKNYPEISMFWLLTNEECIKKNSRFEICVNLANRSHFDNWINFVVLIVMMNVV